MATLNDYTKEELLALAEQFGVDVKASMNKAAIVAEFESDGVTADFIADLSAEKEEEDVTAGVEEITQADDEEPVAEEDEDLVLVRMIRANNTYQIRGYKFTTANPYCLVAEKDADYLIEIDGGFRVASPKEVREFYS